MFFQKLRKANDCIHRGPDIMAHIKKEPCLCLIRIFCFENSFFHFFFMKRISVASHFELQIYDHYNESCHHRNEQSPEFLSHCHPSVFWYDFKIPGIIRNCTCNLHHICFLKIVTLRNYDFFIVRSFFPYLIVISGIFQLVQLHFFDEFLPVHNKNRKSPELLTAFGIRSVYRIKKQHPVSSLHQFKRTGNRIFSAVSCQTRLLFSFRIFNHVQPDHIRISLHRIYLRNDSVFCNFMDFYDIIFILHQPG